MRDKAIQDSEVLGVLSTGYLKFFGIWGAINNYKETGKRNKLIKTKILITLALSFPYIFFQYLSYFFIQVDIQKLIFINLNLLPATQLCCKLLVFWFRIDSQCRLFNLVRKDFLSIPKAILPEASSIFEKISIKTNILCIAAFVVNVSFVALFILNPGISVDYILYHTGDMAKVTTGRKKIFGGWYPIPMAETPYFEIIFVCELIYGTWAGILLAVYVCLYYQVLMCLYAQFTVLSLKASSLTSNPVDVEENINSKGSKKMNDGLYEILQEHQKLLSYTKELRSVYNPLVTLILGIGIFVLIIAIYQFLFEGNGNFMAMFKSLLFLAYQYVEVSMFCFGSASIETASSDLQFAIYSSDWYKADIQFRKDAQMLMVRAMRGETLTAVRMYPINVETMKAILHFTYSASAVVSRMAE